jgi:hypothetical protein
VARSRASKNPPIHIFAGQSGDGELDACPESDGVSVSHQFPRPSPLRSLLQIDAPSFSLIINISIPIRCKRCSHNLLPIWDSFSLHRSHASEFQIPDSFSPTIVGFSGLFINPLWSQKGASAPACLGRCLPEIFFSVSQLLYHHSL